MWLGAVGSQGLDNEYATAIATDAAGNASIVGHFKSTTATFGSTTLVGNSTLPTGYATLVPNTAPLLRVTSLTPTSGTPGQTVTLTGSGFVSVVAVTVQRHAGSVVCGAIGYTQLTAVGAGGRHGRAGQRAHGGGLPAVARPLPSNPRCWPLRPPSNRLSNAWPNPVRTHRDAAATAAGRPSTGYMPPAWSCAMCWAR